MARFTYIYAPEQTVVWYKTTGGSGKTVGKYKAKFIEPFGRLKARILVLSTGERKLVELESIISISDFKGHASDLR